MPSRLDKHGENRFLRGPQIGEFPASLSVESIIESLFDHQIVVSCTDAQSAFVCEQDGKHPANCGSLPFRICTSAPLSFCCRDGSGLIANAHISKGAQIETLGRFSTSYPAKAFCFLILGLSPLQCLCCSCSQTHQPFRLHPHQPAEPYLPGTQQRGPHPLQPRRLYPTHELLFSSRLQSPRACPSEPVPGPFTPDLALPGRAAPQLSGPRLVWLVIGALFDGLPSQRQWKFPAWGKDFKARGLSTERGVSQEGRPGGGRRRRARTHPP
jgi:hypothetical protein